ncbi:MAG: HAD-superfamily hydrolase, subfamily variant 3 [Frankiales bacterium]|nr:HAD-superfamily hydrolase, subfamily variant 3 [Frankiales bacterium]
MTNELLASLGVTTRYDAEQLRLGTTGKSFRRTAAELAATHSASLTPTALELWVAEERRRVTAHLSAVLVRDAKVLAPLALLAERFELAAVSSSASARLTACFLACGLDDLIPADRRYSAEDSLPVPTSKPDPAVYLFALDDLHLKADDAVAVEDSVPGAQAALAAGIRTVGNLQFVPEAERAARARELHDLGVVDVVESWAELEQLLR